MGRTQAFDTTDVVRSARRIFWRNGYEATSLADLEAATGLSRSSIYHAFESKRGLFDDAVESYLEEVVRPRLRPLLGKTVSADALIDYLRGLRDAVRRAEDTDADSGCLLLTAASGPLGRDLAVRETIEGYRTELRSAIGNGVRALPNGCAPDEVDRKADTCTALVIAALALTRVDQTDAVRMIDTALDLIR